MRLIGYGTGEVLDRLSILALKLSHKPDGKHFAIEQSQLLDQVPTSVYKIPSREAIKLTIALTVVNARIWQVEDVIRASRKIVHRDAMETEVLAEYAIRAQALNDERSRLIDAINAAAGEVVQAEKV